MRVAVRCHAKLNLGLEVTGTLPDGRHAIRTIFQAISPHDDLAVEPAGKTSLEVAGDAPAGEENLVLKALRALEEAAGRALAARVSLHKRIPAGAGLGGGSSDAAGLLRAAATLFDLDLDLSPIAAGLGADVAFFLSGGRSLGTGAGDILTPLADEPARFAVAWPGYAVSTAAVYSVYDRVGGDGSNHLVRAAFEVEPRLEAFAAALGGGWTMTGSGSAFFLRCETEEAAQAGAAHALAVGAAWAQAAESVPRYPLTVTPPGD